MPTDFKRSIKLRQILKDKPNRKNKPITHILNGILSISVGITIALFSSLCTATLGVAALFGLGAAALAMLIAETCNYSCAHDSRAKVSKGNASDEPVDLTVATPNMTAGILNNLPKNNNPSLPPKLLLLGDRTRSKKSSILRPALPTITENPHDESDSDESESESELINKSPRVVHLNSSKNGISFNYSTSTSSPTTTPKPHPIMINRSCHFL